jgi:hypothetical protein
LFAKLAAVDAKYEPPFVSAPATAALFVAFTCGVISSPDVLLNEFVLIPPPY